MKVLPGDNITLQPIKTTIGPGIYKDPKTQNVIPTTAGDLNLKVNKKSTNQLVYIESKTKRYIPKTNDMVVGIVLGTLGESYKVSLQDFSPPVMLSMMAFPNATKKNRLNLKVGQVIYARVCQDSPEIDIEIECLDPTTGKDGGFGILEESGYVFDISLNFANELLFGDGFYLEKLASKCKFEIAIGLNGKIWIKCGEGMEDFRDTISASKYLQGCEKVRRDEVDRVLAEHMGK